jgi:hypothetical protein
MLESRQLLINGKVRENMPTRKFSSSGGDVVTPKAAVSGAKDSSDPAGMTSALLVSPLLEDHRRLSQVFLDKGWTLHLTHTLESALGLLRDRPIRVVITERDLPLGDWKDALTALQQLPHQPLFVVTSRLADEEFWAEVLNLGGHNVLAKPFRARRFNGFWRVPGGSRRVATS